MNAYGGGYQRNGTFIEYSKSLIDQLNAHYSEQSSFIVDDFTRTTNTIHYYDSIVLFEKRAMVKPSSKMTGQWSFEYDTSKKTFAEKFKFHLLVRMNKLLQSLQLKGIFIDEMLRLSSKG
jgi:hypothetical protein